MAQATHSLDTLFQKCNSGMEEEKNLPVKHRHVGVADRRDKHNVNSKGRDAT